MEGESARTEAVARRSWLTLERQNNLIGLAQWGIYPFLLILRCLFIRKIHLENNALARPEAWEADVTYVVYANHQSRRDALLLPTALPIVALRRLLPFRFFVANRFLKGVTNAFLTTMGGFPAHAHSERPFGLGHAYDLMKTDSSLVIFPTGRITRQKGGAKRGIVMLATEPSVKLIPVHIEWQSKWSCTICVGEPFSAAGNASADALMEHVYRLSDPLNVK
jgi:1-acyl-sn-glycerol-3-phosphate acyltransferase